MEASPFVTHLAHLVWLLLHRPGDQNEQKATLRRALEALVAGPQQVLLHHVSMAVSNAVTEGRQDQTLYWLSELSVRMASHSVRGLDFDMGTPAREVLEVARAIATPPTPGDDGEAFDTLMVRMAATGVSAHMGPLGFVRRATPRHVAAIPAPARTPVSSMVAIPADADMPAGPPREEAAVAQPGTDSASDAQAIMQGQLMPVSGASEDVDDLLSRLDAAEQSSKATMVVDDVARAAEERARDGQWVAVAGILSGMLDRHERLHDGDARRAYLIGLRYLQKPTLMHGIAGLLPQHRELRGTITRLLAHAGELGADALIQHLISSDSAAARRAFRDALGQCPAAVSALVHLLSDERWYVVRNAAELLGDLGAKDADSPLAAQMAHRESRVRRSVVGALGRLGTSRATLAILQALSDPSADVRLQAAHALAAAPSGRSVPWLIEALDAEHDADVKAALIGTLGRSPTEDAVARLVRTAEPGGLLLRRSAALRLKAIDALAEAGTPAALTALRDLVRDRDHDVREAARRAISRHAASRLRTDA